MPKPIYLTSPQSLSRDRVVGIHECHTVCDDCHLPENGCALGKDRKIPLTRCEPCASADYSPEQACDSCAALGILTPAVVGIPGGDLVMCGPCATIALAYLGKL